jgi:hypothetical protein
MLPTVVALLHELEIRTERMGIDSDEPASFRLTSFATLMHDEDPPTLGTASPRADPPRASRKSRVFGRNKADVLSELDRLALSPTMGPSSLILRRPAVI